MQVYNNVSYPNYSKFQNYPNYQNSQNNPKYIVQKQTPSFTSIQGIGYSGLYEKAPELGQKLLDAFMQNSYAMEFCKKYNAKVFFHAMETGYNSNIKSSIHILYDNPTLSRARKIWNVLTNSEEQVKIHSWQASLEESTAELAEMMLPKTNRKSMSGLLDSHIKTADERMQKILKEREAKEAKKLAEKRAKLGAKEKKDEAEQRLNQSIEKLIESTK